jgi:Mrp family chromosome partitioning ATPase
LSVAAAGARTLVVDADLIGQRLTRGYRLDDKPGFREAMLHGPKAAVYYPSGVERLSILPAGVSDGRDACAVSTKSVKKLIAGVKDDFDVVLVDSGPILGSLEALVVSQHVDGVVLTISREQQKPMVDRAIRQLRSVHAKIAGMVFNKAETADFRRSVGASSLRSIPRNPESTAMVKAGVTSTSGFGSLVDSVQTYMPSQS